MSTRTQPAVERNHIEALVAKEVHRIAKQEVGPSDSLVRSGIVDSLGVVELIAFIEGTFGVELEGDDLEVENFERLGDIVLLIERKRAAG